MPNSTQHLNDLLASGEARSSPRDRQPMRQPCQQPPALVSVPMDSLLRGRALDALLLEMPPARIRLYYGAWIGG